MTGSAMVSLHRTGAELFEIHDLASGRRWSLPSSSAERQLAALTSQDEGLALIDLTDMTERRRQLLEEYHRSGLGVGAWYLAATDDYPFLDYATDGYAEDRKRMSRYGELHPDDDRRVTAVSDPVAPATLLDVEPRLLEMMRIVFGSTDKMRSSWDGVPLFRRTSPSGGSRHPTNGYLILPGHRYAYYFDPIENRLAVSTIALPDSVAEPQVVLTLSPARNRYRYREPRTFRTIFMDVGHLSRTLFVTCAALGLASSCRALLLGELDLQRTAAALSTDMLAELPVLVFTVGDASTEARALDDDRTVRTALGGQRTDTTPPSSLVGLLIDEKGRRMVGSSIAGTRELPFSDLHRPELHEMTSLPTLGGLGEWLGQGWALAKDMLLGAGATAVPAAVPEVDFGATDSSLAATFTRRTERKFTGPRVTRSDLDGMINGSQALAPRLSVGLLAYDVDGMSPGVYIAEKSGMKLVRSVPEADLRAGAMQGIQGQASPLSAAATLCAIATYTDYTARAVGPAALYLMWIEAGAAVQSWILRAEESAIRGLPTPAIRDSWFDEMFDLPLGRSAVIHTLTIGRRG